MGSIGHSRSAVPHLPLVAACFALLAAAAPASAAIYTWNRTNPSDWTTSTNWTPTRSSPATTDTLVIDGAITPSPTIRRVPTQTIRRLRFINGVSAQVETDGTRTLTISGAASPNLEIQAGTSVSVAGSSSRPLTISLASSATASISGQLAYSVNAHRLLGSVTDGIVFNAGSSVTVSSGFTGNLFGSTGTANVVVFAAGSRYIHAAGSSPFGLSAPSSKVRFDAGSEAVFRTASGFEASGRTFANLTIENAVVSSSGTGSFQVDTLRTAGGFFTHGGSGSGSVIVRGDLVNGAGTLSLTSGSGGIQFNGGKVQTVRGDTAVAIVLGSPATIASGTTLELRRTLQFNSGSMTVNGVFALRDTGSVTATNFSYGASGVLRFEDGTNVRTVGSSLNYWPTSSGPQTVEVRGLGIAMTAARTLTTLDVAAAITGASQLTVSGALRRRAGGSMAGSPTYGSSATLVYHASLSVGNEWTSGAVVGAGVPRHVQIDAGAGTVSLPAAARTVPGDLTITTGTLLMDAAGDLFVGGNWTSAGSFVASGRPVTFNGAAATQTLTRAGGETLEYLTIAKTAGVVALGSDLTISAPAGGAALAFSGTTDVLNLNGRNLTLNGPLGGTNANGMLRGSATSGLRLVGSAPAGTLRFESGARTLDSLRVELPGATVTLGTPLTVGAALFLTDGQVVTGADSLTTGSGAIVNRSAGRVTGKLTRTIGTGASTHRFDVGTAAGYTPVEVAFTGVTTGGTMTAFSTDGDHAQIASSGLQLAKNVARVHTLRTSGLVPGGASATFTFLAGDVDAGANPDSFAVRRHAGGVWSGATAGARTATSTQATGLTAFGDFTFGEPVVHTITASAGANGSISPIGTIQVADRTSASFTMTPDAGHHVEDVLVDGGSVGAVTDYTFDSVTASHTIAASFAIDRYPVTVLTSGLGSVSGNDQPDYPFGSSLVLTAVPEVGWEFVSWSGHLNTTFNPVGFQVDSAMVVTANFVRRPLAYTRTTFTAPYTALSEATGASRVLSTADDSTKSVPLPFRFVFSGLPYDSTNYLAINANGYAAPSRTNLTQSLSFLGNNSNMNTLTPPNGLLAPWYDNLAVGPVGTNPAGSVLYQTQSVPGSGRTFVVQWTNVSSYANTTGGQPRQLNFQLVLFENSNVIEFRYGPLGGSSSSNLESASIGVEDSLGGNGNYLDAVTGSRYTNNGMMTSNKWPTRFYRFTPGVPAPLAGSYTIGVGQAYPNLSQAVADLNHRGQSGPVTLLVSGGFVDTTASGGSNQFPILLGPVEGNSAAHTITIAPLASSTTLRYRGTENGTCGNQVLTNVIGNTNEPILGILGADHVTLQNLFMEGGAQVDRGVLLLQSSTTDGAQDNLIQGVSVSLARANVSSIGIQQFVPNTPSGPEGTNSRNRYLDVSVSNAYAGVSLAGSASVFDEDCEIGATPGGASVIGGASSTDIGGGTAQTFGIRAVNQRGLEVHHVEVRNVAGTGSGAVDGISIENLGASTLASGTVEVHHCDVHGLRNTNAGGGRVTGIKTVLTRNAGSVARIYNNFVSSLQSSSTATTSRRIIGIHAQDGGGGEGATFHVDHNSVRIQPTALDAPNACFEIGTTAGPVFKVRNNVFANFTAAQAGAAKHYAWVAPTLGIGPAGSVSDHNVLYVNSLVNGYTGLQGGLDIATLPEWRAATLADSSSLGTNPQFQTSVNLHIHATNPTPVESNGSTFAGAIPWVTDDIDGEPRHLVTPDIGADEGAFAILVDHDMGASAFVHPTAGGSVSQGLSFTPEATFDNTGVQNQTNVAVRFRIRGPQPATTLVYDQTASIASIDAGNSVNVTFPATSIATTGFYVMEATALLGGDQNASNDQITASLDVSGPLSGSYDISFASPPPFHTLTSAIARLNSVGASGPVTFLLADSAYGGSELFPIEIDAYPGASPTNTLTIRPAPGMQPFISGSSTRALFVLDGADHVTIDGSNTVGGATRDVTLLNTNSAQGSAVVWGQTSSGNPATSNVLRNLVAIGAGSNATLFGIGFGGSTISLGSLGDGNHGNTIENCDIRAVQYGIYSAGASAAAKNTGTIITRNTMTTVAPNHIGRGGILVRFENGVQVTRNTIANVGGAAEASMFGISLGMSSVASDAIAGDEVVNATVTRNNVQGVVSTNALGLTAAGLLVAPATSGVTTIQNNMIAGVLSAALDPDLTVGILVGGGAGSTTRVQFNSVHMTGSRPNATAPSFALAIGGANPVVDVRDNILTNLQTGAVVGDPYVLGLDYSPYSNLTCDRNVFFHDTARPFAIVEGLNNTPFGDQASLAAWRTTTGKDATSLFGDPLFVSATNLHIGQSGSPSANAGVAIAGVTVDIDGQTRLDPPDIGADEYTSYTITTTVVGSGTVSRTPNYATYIDGTPVTLVATPAVGHHFVGWAGDTTAAAETLMVVVRGNQSLTATFAINTYAFNTTVVGAGAVTKTPDQALYDHGTPVVVRAVPAEGYHFAGWSGDTTSTVDSLVVTMTRARDVTATFEINTYALGITTHGQGAVGVAPDQTIYDHGTPVTLTATPQPGHAFLGWSGDTSGTDNPITVVMNQARAYTAQFTYAVDVVVSGSGTVGRMPDTVAFAPSDTVRLVASATEGHHFVAWGGAGSGSDETLLVVVDTTKTVTATFEINTYALDATSGGNGTVVRDPDQPAYDHGTVVTVRAVPDVGYHFTGWSGDTTETADSLVVTMVGPRTIVASFEINTYTLDATSGGHGAVVRDPDQATYDHGTVVTLRTLPDEGYHFVAWSGDTTETADSLVVTMTGNRTFAASFEINTYVLDLVIRGGGTVTRVPELSFYDHGTEVTLTALSDPGHAFLGWSGDTTLADSSFTVVMNRARSYTALFSLNLEVTAGPGGSVVKTPDLAGYTPGDVVTVRAVPDLGYHFTGWSGDTTETNDSLVVTLTDDRSYHATFAIDTHTLDLASLGNGAAVKDPDQAVYDYGTVVTLTATPTVGQAFVHWSGDTAETASPMTIVVTRDRSVLAQFTYSVAVDTVGPGVVEREPNLEAFAPGDTLRLTAVPPTGYHFAGWTGDTTTADNPLTLDVFRSYALTATFEINTYEVDAVAGAGGSVIRTPNLPLYVHGQTVELIPSPDVGHHFTTWSGDTTSTANPLVLTVERPWALTASFEVNGYALTTTTRGNGTIARAPDLGEYTHGSTVELTASAVHPYTFSHWEGAASGAANPLIVTMDAAKHVQAVFESDSFTVDVIVNGGGTLDQSPIQALYYRGTVVSLTATPDSGHQFDKWGGDLLTAYNPISFAVDSNMTVVLDFVAAPPPVMNFTVVGDGAVAKSPDAPDYPINSYVQISATPGPDHFFAGWSGDILTTLNPVSVWMDKDKLITATFLPTFFVLETDTLGGGSVTRSPDQASYPRFSSVEIAAVPGPGATFMRWAGDTAATANPMMLPMNRDRALTAVFGYPVTRSTTGQGSIVISPPGTLHAFGDTVRARAVAAPGYSFAGWSGDASGEQSATEVVVGGPTTLAATFVPGQFALQVDVEGEGGVTRSPDAPLYVYGAEVVLSALPAEGWEFLGWRVVGGETERRARSGIVTRAGHVDEHANPLTLEMIGDRRLVAVFAIQTHEANVTALGHGTVARDPDQPRYDHFTPLSLTATPAPGHAFLGWAGDTATTANPLDLVMTRPRTLHAQFTYEVNVAASGDGTVSKAPDQLAFAPGDSVTVAATPAVGHHFVGWTGDTTAAAASLPLVVFRDWTLTGVFEINTYTLGIEVLGNGAVTRTPDQATYDHGTVVTLRALAPVGHHFVGWGGDTTETADSLVVTMTGDRSYSATFAINQYTLAAVAVGGGSVTVSPEQAAYDHGTEVTLRAVSDVGHHFIGWSGDTTETADSLVVTMTGNRTYTAAFAIDTFTLTTASGPNGMVARTPDQASYDYGAVVVIRGVPDVGHHFTGWSGDTTETADSLVVTMTQDRSYTAAFEINVYTLTVQSEGSGTAAKAPDQPTYTHGTPVMLTTTPNAGHNFLYWSGDTLTSEPTLEIVMTADRAYTASFTVSLEVIVVGTGTVTKEPDQALYEPYDLVTLTATAGVGQRFVGWEGDTVTALNVIEVLMDANKSFVAEFEAAAATAALPDAPARIEIETPAEGWTVGEAVELGWRAGSGGGLVDLSLARTPGGEVEALAAGLDAAGRFRWTVTGPEASEARLVARLRLADGREASDTMRVAIVEPVRALALGPIAPNPARGRTSIPFAIPRESRVRLSVVDVQGREVAVLADGLRAPGRYTAVWEARGSGTSASPGVYFVRLEFPGQTIVRRVTIAP